MTGMSLLPGRLVDVPQSSSWTGTVSWTHNSGCSSLVLNMLTSCKRKLRAGWMKPLRWQNDQWVRTWQGAGTAIPALSWDSRCIYKLTTCIQISLFFNVFFSLCPCLLYNLSWRISAWVTLMVKEKCTLTALCLYWRSKKLPMQNRFAFSQL